MRLLTIFVIMMLIVILNGCSGGFDSDSGNAGNLDQSIFGPDTTAR